MSTTRLLVLGAVRLFQPAHGYLVRRELLSWDVESWAAVDPGSIYNMLRSLTRDGLLEEVGADRDGGPARVAYQVTMDGEVAYFGLLNKAFREIDDRDPHLLPAALCFLPTMTREQALSNINPFKHVVDGVRAAFRGDLASADSWAGLAITVGLVLLGVWYSTRTFRRESA